MPKSTPTKSTSTKTKIRLNSKPQARVSSAEKAMAKIAKAKVFELEKKNTRNVYFYHSGGNWYKAIGVSALIYNFWIKPKNPQIFTSVLRPDTDNYSISVEGSISVAKMDDLEQNLLKLGFTKQQSRDPEILWYRVPKDFSVQKLENWRSVQEEKKQDLNETLMVASSDPNLATKIRELSSFVYNKVKNFDRNTQELVGKHLLDETRQLFIAYRTWAVGDIGKLAGLKEMLHCIDLIESDLMFLLDLHNSINIDHIAKISFRAEEVRKVLKQRLQAAHDQDQD